MNTRDLETARAWVEVDLGALAENYRTVCREAAPRVGALPVVKTDAYGLGVRRVVAALEPLEPWGYAVATAAEGGKLRQLGIRRPILLLFSAPEEMAAAAEQRLTPAIGDLLSLERWWAIARNEGNTLPFHLEIDTGIGRAGFRHDAVESWLPRVMEASSAELEWEGTFTHFHSAEVEEPTAEQWERFQNCLAEIPDGAAGLIHAASSAAALQTPDYGADLIRPGLFLYGGLEGSGDQPLAVATVKARVLAVRDVPAGWSASYGATHVASRPSTWATLAIGYGDGVRRELSNTGYVRFGDEHAPIVGRVCMDVLIADVSDMSGDRVVAGDVATVIGGPPDAPTSLKNVAARCGTIAYEILTGLTPRLRRIWVDDGGI